VLSIGLLKVCSEKVVGKRVLQERRQPTAKKASKEGGSHGQKGSSDLAFYRL